MIPISLSLQNFLSYGEGVPPLDFTGFHVACISGRNGHGKSALLDAITYALWGEARKAGTERRANDGLLRIGATEMQVDFEFRLETDRYRVSRSYRKSGRTATSRLELQMFSPETGGYKTLSEEGSVRKTQESLNTLLRMNYDTFINSAFILQGRADEFTRRNARERKTILTDILGLSRYDDMAALARAQVQEIEIAYNRAQIKYEEIETATAQKSDLKKQHNALDSSLVETEKNIEKIENRLEVLRTTLTQRERLSAECDALNSDQHRIDTELQDIQTQIETTQKEVATYQETINQKQTILSLAEKYQTLQSEETELQKKQLALRPLEQQKNELEREVEQARHEVERRHGEWDLRVNDAERDIVETEALLQDQEDIDARIEALQKAREQDREWENQRENRDRIEKNIHELERQLDAENATLQVAINTKREQLRQQEVLVKQRDSRHAALVNAQNEHAKAKSLEAESDHVRDQGSAFSPQIDADRNRLQSVQKACEEIQQQQNVLQNAHDSQCPLCGNDLDETHRLEVTTKFASQYETNQTGIKTLEIEIQNAETKREQLRKHYQDLKNQLTNLEELARAVAAAEAAQKETENAVTQVEAIKNEITHLEAQCVSQSENSPTARALQTAQQELQKSPYNLAEHRTLKEKLKDLESVETRRAQLQAAKDRLQKALATLPDYLEKRQTAKKWLENKLYASKQQEILHGLEDEIKALNYDPTHHQKVIQERDLLKEAPTQIERLQVAEREYTNAQQRFQAVVKRNETLNEQKTKITQRLPELEKTISEAQHAAQESDALQNTLRENRQQRDQLMQQRATFQAQIERCESLEADRETIQKQRKENEHEIHIHKELVTAFGKDGIQALIIEQAIPEIEEEANRILASLTQNRTQIALESLRDLKKGGTRETLDIKISDELGERSYELYSGGEAFRVDFAIRIALSKLLASRTGARLRTLVIDEGFGTQDAEGLDHLVEAIQAISEDFEKILVITHVESLKQAFPVRIEVTKYPDQGSRFEVLY
jgi:exonuclease SbcC